jgi:hypothetical protein
VVKDLFNDIRLVYKTDDPHLTLAFGTSKRIGFIDLSDEVRITFIAPRRPQKGL